MEFRSCCRHHIRTECPVVDKMLSSKNGYSFPRGNSYRSKKAFVEFWETVEFLRVLLGSPDDLAASFHSSFLNVLPLPEQLSFQGTRREIIWIGSDATLGRFGAIDFTHTLPTTFPTSSTPRVSATDGQFEDELIIAISEFCSFIFFLMLRGESLRGRLVAYTGDNNNVIGWLLNRQAGDEWARFLLRILARFEQSLDFRTYPIYISTLNNIDCDNLTRLHEGKLPHMPNRTLGITSTPNPFSNSIRRTHLSEGYQRFQMTRINDFHICIN